MPDLGTDQLRLMKEGYCKDLTLVCEGGRQLEVHKFVLAARSVVFRTMMDTEMTERKSGTVEVKGFDQEVVIEFVDYLYSDKISENFSNFSELLKIAHQYQVSSLVDMCSNLLADEVSKENVAQLAILAEDYEIEELTEKCAEFLAMNIEHLEVDKLRSVPSSLVLNAFAKYRSNSVTSPSYVANFLPNPGEPLTAAANLCLYTKFKVSRETNLVGIGLHVSSVGNKLPICVELSQVNPYEKLLTMDDTSLVSSDLSKPVKISFPQTILNPGHYYKVCVEFKSEFSYFKWDKKITNISIPMKTGDLKIDLKFNNPYLIPMLYFED